MIWPFRNEGFSDNVVDRRKGLIFVSMSYAASYSVPSLGSSYDIILEVVEMYNDTKFSKVKVVNIPFDRTEHNIMSVFNPWIESSRVHWLTPSTIVDRDNKLNEILK